HAQRDVADLPPAPPIHAAHVDIVALDRTGRPALDLKASEVDLTEDGESRQVEAIPAFSDGPRLFAIFVDEFHLTPGASTERARAAVTRLIDRELRPDDRLIVMKPLDSLLGIQFTNDRETARQIAGSIDGRRGDYTPRTVYERENWAGDPERIEASRMQ